MRIIHFANETFGSSFTESFLSIKDSFPDIPLILVISTSTYNRYQKLMPIVLKDKINRKMKGDIFDLYEHIWFTKDINQPSFLRRIRKEDIGIITGFNQIFNLESINKFAILVNVHPSLLPYYRGPVPSYWVIKNKEEHSGWTLHKITPIIDQGEIIYQKALQVTEGETINQLDNRISLDASKKVSNLIQSYLEVGKFDYNVLEAEKYYTNLISYLSFPKN